MASTFSQIYLQFVFAVKGRQSLLQKAWRQEVFKYLGGIVEAKGHKVLIVNGVSDHVHIFVSFKASQNPSDLARDLKMSSAKFINKRGFISGLFAWQEGYGVFSYAHSQKPKMISYIANQEIHHTRKSFKDEYLELLRKMDVTFEEKYTFEWIDDVIGL